MCHKRNSQPVCRPVDGQERGERPLRPPENEGAPNFDSLKATPATVLKSDPLNKY